MNIRTLTADYSKSHQQPVLPIHNASFLVLLYKSSITFHSYSCSLEYTATRIQCHVSLIGENVKTEVKIILITHFGRQGKRRIGFSMLIAPFAFVNLRLRSSPVAIAVYARAPAVHVATMGSDMILITRKQQLHGHR